MTARTLPQNRLFHAMVRDIAAQRLLWPWKSALAAEAWKRYLIASWVREIRLEAYANGEPDPFPVRPVPSRQLDSRQMDELIEFALWFCADRLDLYIEDKPAVPTGPAQTESQP